MQESSSILLTLIVIGAFFVMPFLVSAHICKTRNRSVAKGLFVTLFFGWIATACLWLALKTRDPQTGSLR